MSEGVSLCEGSRVLLTSFRGHLAAERFSFRDFSLDLRSRGARFNVMGDGRRD